MTGEREKPAVSEWAANVVLARIKDDSHRFDSQMNALKRIPCGFRGLMSVWMPYLMADGLALYNYVAVIMRLLWSRTTLTIIFCHSEIHLSLGVMPFGLCYFT